MKLSSKELDDFDRDGYIFLKSLFSAEEVQVLRDEAEKIYSEDRPATLREKGSNEVRTAFATHMYSKPYAKLARHPRLIEPAGQVIGEDELYMHQFKINGKAAFDGEVWQWHQDYGTWKRDDLMPEPKALNVAVFLEEVNEFNGPLMFIPGSHRKGVIDAGHDLDTTSYPLWTIDNEVITKLADRGGIVAPKGAAGSMVMFHSCLVHCSAPNLSPWSRRIVYLSLCAVSNHIRAFKRPEFIAHRNFEPLKKLRDDCLLTDYSVPLPWANGIPKEAQESAT